MPPKKKTYIKKDPISHVLDRPDMYVGSKRPKKIEDFIAIRENSEFKIIKKTITYSPAILRIFVEVLSNAIDNVERSKKAKIPCTMIKVSIDRDNGETSVWNDGDIIPIEINEAEGIYNHSLIFGHLMAGSNFDDEEERLISGRNGIGGKATNIFSKKFIVKGLDPDNKKVLEQTWTNNMRNTTDPKITDTKLKNGFTKITYFPDFKQFDLEGYTDDIINLYTKYVIDAAMLTNVKVYLNEELIPVNNLVSYSKLYDSLSDDSLLIKNKNSEVLIMPSNINEFQAISFVNGVYTRIGGAHVDAFAEAIFRPIVEKFNKKGKPQLNIKDVKQFFRLFVVSTVINPEFSSQDKCVDPNTKILMWDGTTKYAKELKIGDVVISSDGLPSNIIKLCNGKDKMYSVVQEKYSTYTVNSKHKLVLCCPFHKQIRWHDKNKQWVVGWFDYENLNYRFKRFKINKDEDKNIKLLLANKFLAMIDDNNIYDIEIEKYIKLNKGTKRKLSGIKSTVIQWSEQDILIDPYILGMWLGDGMQKGNSFSSDDVELVEKWKNWGNINDILITKYSKFNYGIISKTGKLNNMNHKYLKNPFKTNLEKYNLINDKRIPKEYIINSRENRLKLLAGIVDTDGCIQDNGTTMVIVQGLNHSKLIEDIILLVKSLGFTCYHRIKNTSWKEYKTNNIKNGKAHHLHISGKLEDIPVLLQRKKGVSPKIRNVHLSNIKKIIPQEEGEYIGFELDRNNRFLLGDFTVTHNCKLEAPKIDAEIKQTEINKILKWNVISEIEDIIKMKEMSVLKKSEKKKKGYTKIEGMDHANNAGGKLGYQCSLILCEGLSAKTYAVAGINKGVYGKSGRDYFAILPLKGKLLNCRNSIPTTIAKNKVITDLIQALNLRHDLDYTEDKNYKTLSYGKVILLTDADVDGLHISGLLMNFFHYLFPSLLERKDPFVVSMCTPIVRVFNPKGDLLFYDENKFRKFASEQTKTFKSKYYKGLGTTKPEDVKDTFGLKMIEYINDENSLSSMNKIFHKKFSDVRKDWLSNYDPNPEFSLDDEGNIVNMEISTFLNNEVIKFSHNDCKRSIPSLFDGLKCLDPKTPVLMYNGDIKIAKNICIGDVLVGDDGKSCKVINTCYGNDTMYKIEQCKGQDYIVNKNHILSLKFSGHKSIYWSKTTESWQVKWIDTKSYKIISKNFGIRKTGIHKNSKKQVIRTKEEVYEDVKNFCKYIPDNNIIDISVEDYLKLNKTTKKHLCGFKSNGIYWDKKDVSIDPYILGSWLGDGTSNGKSICGEDVELLNYWREWCILNDCEMIHKNRDIFYIRRAGNSKKNILPVGFNTMKNCKGCSKKQSIICASVSELEEMSKLDINNQLLKNQIKIRKNIDNNQTLLKLSNGNISKYKIPLNPLKQNLFKYDLIKNKHIPKDYILNDKDTRLKVLAGIIDTDGCLKDNGRTVEIIQSECREHLIDEILFLSQSLGFTCSKHVKYVNYLYKNKKEKKKNFVLTFSGNILNEIPTLILRKKCYNPIKRDVLNTMIKISCLGNGNFNGFTVDNESNRFLLGDFTVTHNCSQRKVLYAVKKRNLTYNKQSLKVAQLGGYVAEHTNYHHGEQNLFDTIINMAQDYVGSNNIPLFYRDGMFGCVDPNTDILLWNGKIIKANCVKLGDELIGDDGTKRIVSKTVKGVDKMYEIVQSYGENYKVNSQHILTVHYSGNMNIIWNSKTNSWRTTYYDINKKKFISKSITANKDIVYEQPKHNKLNYQIAQKIRNEYINENTSSKLEEKYNISVRSIGRVINNETWIKEFDINVYNKSTLTKDEAYNKMVEYLNTLPDSTIFDINIQDYLNLPKYIKEKIKGVSNNSIINWYKKEVIIDPYILGLWLGDGDQTGGGFSSTDDIIVKEWVKWCNKNGMSVIHSINGENHENYHYCIRRKHKADKCLKHLPIGYYKHSSSTCIGCNSSKNTHLTCDWVYNEYIDEDVECVGYTTNNSVRYDLNPFKSMLRKYELVKNKDIPIDYLINDKQTRLELLAGFIDTDGTVKYNGEESIPHIEISQSNKTHGHLIDKLDFLCKSLGFKTSVNIYNITRKTGYISEMKILSIFGNNLDIIPTKLERKKIKSYKRKYNTYYSISIKEADQGEYVGWYIDKNERFLLGDFTVTHNTRLVGGKDSASPRYIFTKMESITPYIFREEDDVLLEHVVDDGDVVEPIFYIPIIPMILVNGAIGIGTGWSSSIPCYNPLDLIECIKIWLDNDGEVILTDPDDGNTLSMFPEIEPWYRDFKGKIEKSKDNKKYISYGCFNQNKDKIEITELPIGMWTDKFKETAEDWLVDKKIKSLKNYSSPREVNFIITESEDGFACNVNNMGLYSYLHTTNMVLFNEKEQLKKYTIDEIINEFCILRYAFYTKRKNYIINKLEKELKHLGNKQRFIQEIIDKKLNIMNVDENLIIKDLETRGYDKENKTQDADEEDNKNGYNYLLKLPVRTLTANQVKKIKNDIESLMKELEIVKKTSEKKMWLNDLKELDDEYTKWIKKMNNISNKDDKKETKKKVIKNKK